MSHGVSERLCTKRAALYVGVAAQTLVNWRSQGIGPPYAKRGRSVSYLATDLDRWIAASYRVVPRATACYSKRANR